MPSRKELRQIASQASRLVREIGTTRRKRNRQQSKLDVEKAKLQEKYGPGIESLKQEEEQLVEELVKLVIPHFSSLVAPRTKGTVKLRSGELIQRTTDVGIDELIKEAGGDAVIMQRLKRLGGLRRFTKVKRVLDKRAIAKDAVFMAKLGLKPRTKTRLIIQPNQLQGETSVTPDPLSVDITTEGD